MRPFAKLKSRAKVAAKPGKAMAMAGAVGLGLGAAAGVAAVKKGPELIRQAAERVAKTG